MLFLIIFSNQRTNMFLTHAENYFRVTLINSAKPDEKILFKMKYMKR